MNDLQTGELYELESGPRQYADRKSVGYTREQVEALVAAARESVPWLAERGYDDVARKLDEALRPFEDKS